MLPSSALMFEARVLNAEDKKKAAGSSSALLTRFPVARMVWERANAVCRFRNAARLARVALLREAIDIYRVKRQVLRDEFFPCIPAMTY